MWLVCVPYYTQWIRCKKATGSARTRASTALTFPSDPSVATFKIAFSIGKIPVTGSAINTVAGHEQRGVEPVRQDRNAKQNVEANGHLHPLAVLDWESFVEGRQRGQWNRCCQVRWVLVGVVCAFDETQSWRLLYRLEALECSCSM